MKYFPFTYSLIFLGIMLLPTHEKGWLPHPLTAASVGAIVVGSYRLGKSEAAE